MSELTRANKVTVNATTEGYKADYNRTHKHIRTVTNDEVDGLEIPDDVTKSGARELFRAYVIEHASDFGVDWNPADMRTAGNIRKSSYMTDDELSEDAMGMVLPMARQLVDNCKYGLEWGGISLDFITPMKQTPKGTDLSTMGIIDGKYEKSGKWAWATIGFVITMKFKGEEIYLPIEMQLVSGQLKKPKVGITAFNEAMKREIVDAKLATEEELDPPKEKKSKATPKEEEQTETPTEMPAEEVVKEQKPKYRRRATGKKSKSEGSN